MLLGLSIAFVIVALDQLTKFYIMHEVLGGYAIINYTSFFNLVYAWNTGVSFSMFNNMGIWGVVILSGISLLIVSFLIYWMYTEQVKIVRIALSFIIGGAVGNVIDRIRLGAVFDFLDFHIGTHHWPAFNVADSFICIGATIIVLQAFRTKNRKGDIN